MQPAPERPPHSPASAGRGDGLTAAAPATPAPAAGPLELIRSRGYVGLLMIAAILGIPISAFAYGFLALVAQLQTWIFTDLPKALGFTAEPTWWPVPWLVLAGLLVALVIAYLPGEGGEKPAEGFKSGVLPVPVELPGIFLAATATLALGAVLGPEAPLIALGGGLAVLLVKLAKRDAPPNALRVVGASGSFAAISALLGSPLLGAFLLMEAAGIGGPMLTAVLLPGLLASGVGAVVFVGLAHWTGLGTFSLAVPHLPAAGPLTIPELVYAAVTGLLAAPVGTGIRRLALALQPVIAERRLLLTPTAGLAIAGLAVIYELVSGRSSSQVLFSGQSALTSLIDSSAGVPVAATVLLVACKALAYGLSLSSFRGGPVFPALFIGAAAGVAMSHLPGLELVPAVGMGMGAMAAVMLRLPLTAALLAAVLLQADGLAVVPPVIIAVVIAYVASARLAR